MLANRLEFHEFGEFTKIRVRLLEFSNSIDFAVYAKKLNANVTLEFDSREEVESFFKDKSKDYAEKLSDFVIKFSE